MSEIDPQVQQRIERFAKMVEGDPNDEVAQFSLGRAYMDGSRFTDAIASLNKAVQINGNLSKAYELLGQSHLRQNNLQGAIEAYSRGYVVANERGDMAVLNICREALSSLNAALPELPKKAAAASVPVSEGQVLDSRTGAPGTRLPKPPYNNALGRYIQEHVSEESWKEWIKMGTKVINELRLPLNDPQAQKLFDQHMYDFLNLKPMPKNPPA